MRIGYTHNAFCRQPYTGIARYLTKLITTIGNQRNSDLKVIAPIFTDKFLVNLEKEYVFGSHSPLNTSLIRIFSRSLNSCIAPSIMRRWKPDIVHETYYSTQSISPPRSKVVLTVHDMIHERFPENFHGWNKTLKSKEIAIKRADHIICISQNTRNDLLSLYDIP
jgi:hypothetical protein